MTYDIGWEKILANALASPFVTACLTEPVKARIQRRLRRRELRRSLYWEIMNNFAALQGQLAMAKHDDEMKDGVGQRFAMGYKRRTYDLALKDAHAFYSLGHSELYWIEGLYRDFEGVIHREFESREQSIRNAEFVAGCVLNNLKNRYLNKRLMFGANHDDRCGTSSA